VAWGAEVDDRARPTPAAGRPALLVVRQAVGGAQCDHEHRLVRSGEQLPDGLADVCCRSDGGGRAGDVLEPGEVVAQVICNVLIVQTTRHAEYLDAMTRAMEIKPSAERARRDM
jgi:hypothetical protein